SCPFDAIKIVDGVVLIIEEDCKGCKKCVPVCPYNAIRMDEKLRIAFKCDLCGGAPACVPECVTGALTFTEVD
ncbi:MAG TPA: 4Fe-4S ferredoxin, partial [Spirochaeta sp.]|nr:4Fe-4S ferredoxin [Spirochaeta sp.]